MRLTAEIRDALLGFVEKLVSRGRLDASNSLLTDRTFLVKAPKLLRASGPHGQELWPSWRSATDGPGHRGLL